MQHLPDKKHAEPTLLQAEALAYEAYYYVETTCKLLGQLKAENVPVLNVVSIYQQKALELFKKASEMGSMTAMSGLAFMYFNGLGVPENSELAMEYFKNINVSANRGDAAGQYALGLCYLYGTCLKKNEELVTKHDEKLASKYLNLAAEQGYAPAQFNIWEKQHRFGSYDGGPITLCQLAAEQGFSPAQNRLARHYKDYNSLCESKENRLVKDKQKEKEKAIKMEAVKYYTLAADQGNADAQVFLSGLYEKGECGGTAGVPTKDLKEAKKYMELAAEQGNVPALYDMADSYCFGKMGLPNDFKKAAAYYRQTLDLAVNSSNDRWLARNSISRLYQLYCKNQGNPYSLCHLVLCLDNYFLNHREDGSVYIPDPDDNDRPIIIEKEKILEAFNELAKNYPEQLIAFLEEYPQDIPRVRDLLGPGIIKNPDAYQKFAILFAKIQAQIHAATPLPTDLQPLVMEYLMPVNIQTPQTKEIQKAEIQKVEAEAKKAADLKQKSDAENERRKAEIDKKKNADTPARSKQYEDKLLERKKKKLQEETANPYHSFLWSQPPPDEEREKKLQKRELKVNKKKI